MYKRVVKACLLALWYLTGGGCGGLTVGPFYPENMIYCGADVDCPTGDDCRFLTVDSRAVCMPVGATLGGTW